MQVLHRLEDGQLVHEVVEKEPEEVQKGPLEETDLSKLKVPTIIFIPKFLRVSGSQIYARNRSPNDIDIIVCGEEEEENGRIVVVLDESLRLKVDRFIKERFKIKGETCWHGTPFGANWKNLPIFDLALVPRNPLKFEEMNEPEFAEEFYKEAPVEKAMGAEAKKMADASKKEDKVEVGRFFYPLKTSLSPFEYRVGEIYGIDEMVKKLKQLAQRRKVDTEIVPVFLNKKYDGIHCQCHVWGGKVIIYSDQGEDYTPRLPTMVKEAKAIAKDHTVVWDLELEWWKGGEHQAREVTAGHFNPKSKEPIDDSEAMANVFDCLFDNEDIHKLKQSERLKHLEAFKWPQSTIGKPSLKHMFNLVPYELVETGSALKQKAGKYIHAVASEGMMLKEDAPYSLTGASSTIYKLKTFAEIHGIVWKKIETKTKNVWNYDYALSFTAQDKINPKFVVEVKGKEFTNVGRSLNTAVNVPVGGIITIRFHTINLYTDAKTGLKHIGVYEPRFYEYRKGDVSPDSFSSAVKIGRDSGLLIEKAMFVGIEFLRKGEALLVDEEFDVVEIAKEDAEFLSKIENTNYRIVKNEKRFLLKQDPYLHLPPEGNVYKYGIQHHFRRKSVHADDRNETE